MDWRLLTFLAFTTTVVLSKERPLLTIRQGKLEGYIAKSGFGTREYYAFKGIPYAEPPLGEYRFQPPEPHKGWDGIKSAKKFGSECPQVDVIYDDTPHGSEDCLFLNIYTPHLKKDLKDSLTAMPVMMWIHSGLFRSGSGDSQYYGPNYFMEEDVILITVNYRLGVLGFLDLEDDVISGNMGMKDMIMALKWIQDNIEEFGGDPKRVTIFGDGAGGMAVDLLILSPKAKGLFSRAISQSGVSLQSSLLDWGGRERAIKLAELLGYTSTKSEGLLNFFKGINPLDFPINLTRTVGVDETKDKQFGILVFSPTVNKQVQDPFLDKYPEEIFDSGELPNPDVSIMIGFNSQESIYYSQYFVRRPPFLRQIDRRFQYLLPLRGLYAKFPSRYYNEIAYRIKHFYFPNGTIDANAKTAMDDYLTMNSDGTVYPIDKTVKAYLKSSKRPVYYYRFNYEGSLNYFKSLSTDSIFEQNVVVKVKGASKYDEICYMFKCDKIKGHYKELHKNPESRDLKMIKKLVRLWTNFAKTGDPTPKNDDLLEGLTWNPVTRDELNYLDIDVHPKMGTNPNSKSIEFWDAMYEHYTPLAKNGVLIDDKDEL